MMVTKQLTVPIDLYSIFDIYTMEVRGCHLLFAYQQSSRFCAQQKKETEVWNNFKGKPMMTEFVILGELSL